MAFFRNEHKIIPLGFNHPLHNWEFADAAERTAYSYSGDDVGKLAFQQDSETFWLITDVTSGTATFLQLGAAEDLISLILTGVSFAAATAITDTDTALAAFGKLQAQITLRATLASPALSGIPTAPTAATGTDTTQLSTTAFVQQEITAIPESRTPTFIASGNSFTVPTDTQCLAALPCRIDGDLIINGDWINL